MNKAAPNIKATANKYDWQIIAVKSQCILQQIHYFTAKYQQFFLNSYANKTYRYMYGPITIALLHVPLALVDNNIF